MIHRDEIIRWANSPQGTEVWVKDPEYNNVWEMVQTPSWDPNKYCVIDDEWAEIRMAIIDGKTIQNYDVEKEVWEDIPSKSFLIGHMLDHNLLLDKPDGIYRVKPSFSKYLENTDGVWCWVKNEGDTDKWTIKKIVDYTGGKWYPYQDEDGEIWADAVVLDPQPKEPEV